MATTTVSSELSVMNVMRSVASAATSVDGFDLFQRTAVTFVAADSCVSTRQWELSLQVMIESHLVPGNRVMAFTTDLTKITAMRVFFFVAGYTFRPSVAKGLVRMAVNAFFLAVLAEQRESRQVVIKKYRVLPADFGMTIFTLCTERFFVGVIIQMAAITGRV